MAAETTMLGVLRSAAAAIKEADALYLLAGAGMGVSAGLGTFRGKNAGIWPPLESRGLQFPQMSNPDRFEDDDELGGPHFAWAFWKWRIDAYMGVPTSRAYEIVGNWATQKHSEGSPGSFVYTSNIDGHFIRLPIFGEDRVFECHGSVAHLQCQRTTGTCSHAEIMWPTPVEQIRNMPIDPETDRVVGDLPMCQGTCGKPARPTVLMFNDASVLETEMDRQMALLSSWKMAVATSKAKIVAIEIGAGTAIPTVRWEAERFALQHDFHLIRINPEAPQITPKLGSKAHSVPLGGEVALVALDALLKQSDDAPLSDEALQAIISALQK